MKRLTLHRLALLLSTLPVCEFLQKLPYNNAELFDTYVKEKTMKFFGLATEICFLRSCRCKSSLHCFFKLIFFC
jgi:hypothetical protein